MLNSIETADVFLNILYNKSCFLCYKMSSNMTNVAEVLEIHDSNSNKMLALSEIVNFLFPSHNIICSQACRNCSDLLTRMYIIMIKNRFITNIVNTFTDKFKSYIKESNAANDLIVNLTLVSKEDNNQINTDSTNTIEVNTQITNVIESGSIEEPQCTKKTLYHNHTKKRKKKYYNCNDCSYRSLCKGTLEGHINKHHIKARPFVCHICCKSFYTKSNLTEHAQTHNKVGEVCDVCGDVFGRRRSLVDHLRLHSNDRQYKCDLCDKYFVNSGRRLDHIKRNHLEKTECCFFCDKKFGMKKELIRHVKSVHT